MSSSFRNSKQTCGVGRNSVFARESAANSYKNKTKTENRERIARADYASLNTPKSACFQRSRIVALDPAGLPRTMKDPSVALSDS